MANVNNVNKNTIKYIKIVIFSEKVSVMVSLYGFLVQHSLELVAIRRIDAFICQVLFNVKGIFGDIKVLFIIF